REEPADDLLALISRQARSQLAHLVLILLRPPSARQSGLQQALSATIRLLVLRGRNLVGCPLDSDAFGAAGKSVVDPLRDLRRQEGYVRSFLVVGASRRF